MTALLVVRQDLDWNGFVVVMTILALVVIAFAPITRDWFHRGDDQLQDLIDQALDLANEVDHAPCSNSECAETICACRTAAECTGCTTLGCCHGEGLCWDCRLGCRQCAADERVLRDLDWAVGR